MGTPPKCDCGSCQSCYKREWRRKNPDKVKAAKERWGRSRDRSGDPKSLEYSKAYREQNLPKMLDYLKSKHLEDPRKRTARNLVNSALRYGRLERLPCEVCGAVKSQAHHDDYDKPLEVVWLCSKHHADRHREMARDAHVGG